MPLPVPVPASSAVPLPCDTAGRPVNVPPSQLPAGWYCRDVQGAVLGFRLAIRRNRGASYRHCIFPCRGARPSAGQILTAPAATSTAGPGRAARSRPGTVGRRRDRWGIRAMTKMKNRAPARQASEGPYCRAVAPFRSHQTGSLQSGSAHSDYGAAPEFRTYRR